MVTEASAYTQLSALCARAEHCSHEMMEKMRRWDMPDDARKRVLERLVAERFVDDERYARAFVNDKVRYNKWGRRKVEQALWQKGIAEDIRCRVLDEVDDEDYLAILRPLLEQKRRSLAAATSYETYGRLMRFAMQRGFTPDLVVRVLGEEGEE